MSFINLNELYVPTTGDGTIDGDLEVSGNLTVNDGSGEGTTYDVAAEITELKDAWDSVSQDSGWVNLYVVDNLAVRARKICNVVYLYGESSGGYTVSGNDYVAITTLPVGWRPFYHIPLSVDAHGGDNATATGYIAPNGILYLYSGSANMTHWRCFVSFPIG